MSYVSPRYTVADVQAGRVDNVDIFPPWSFIQPSVPTWLRHLTPV